MKILLVYPRFPKTYWGYQYSLPLAGKRGALPPLGLLSLAALLPESWDLRLVDLNIRDVREDELAWADAVFTGGMRVQLPSMREVVARAKALRRPSVLGGPAATTALPGELPDADVIFKGEVETRVETLIAAVESACAGGTPSVLDAPEGSSPPMSAAPVPDYELLDLKNYASASLQYSRGCPFTCEFCDIIEIFGRVPRVKTPAQVLAELDALYHHGYRGSVFFVDDNFIGNRSAVKKLLPKVAAWQRVRGYPFEFYTEASMNLASDETLVAQMVEAGFTSVFLGIETPSPEALKETHKMQNLAVDPRAVVDRLSRAGIEVMGGFIVGFDNDGPEAFELQRRFILGSPIPLAMVGVLTALPGTALWRRLSKEGRLRQSSNGDQFGRPNFEPIMEERTLLAGYHDLMRDLYTVDAYYDRCEAHLLRAPRMPGRRKFKFSELLIVLRTIWRIGVRSQRRRRYWRLLGKTLLHAPHAFPAAIAQVIKGEHMIRYTEEDVLPRIKAAVAEAEASAFNGRGGTPRREPSADAAGPRDRVPAWSAVAR